MGAGKRSGACGNTTVGRATESIATVGGNPRNTYSLLATVILGAPIGVGVASGTVFQRAPGRFGLRRFTFQAGIGGILCVGFPTIPVDPTTSFDDGVGTFSGGRITDVVGTRDLVVTGFRGFRCTYSGCTHVVGAQIVVFFANDAVIFVGPRTC